MRAEPVCIEFLTCNDPGPPLFVSNGCMIMSYGCATKGAGGFLFFFIHRNKAIRSRVTKTAPPTAAPTAAGVEIEDGRDGGSDEMVDSDVEFGGSAESVPETDPKNDGGDDGDEGM